MCTTKGNEKKYVKHYTGFTTIDKFTTVLNFIEPNGNRDIIYWNSRAGKGKSIDMAKLFDSEGTLKVVVAILMITMIVID